MLRVRTGPAHVKLLGRDADLGPKPELAAIGETSGGIDIHCRRINTTRERVRSRFVFGEDRFPSAWCRSD